MTCLVIAVLSSLPDIDLYWQPFVKHRGITHTFLCGVIFGTVFGFIFHYAGFDWFIGFVGGFGATLLHILGDVFSHETMKPLRPFSQYEVKLGLFRSSNWVVNKGFMALGGLAFFTVVLKYGSYL